MFQKSMKCLFAKVIPFLVAASYAQQCGVTSTPAVTSFESNTPDPVQAYYPSKVHVSELPVLQASFGKQKMSLEELEGLLKSHQQAIKFANSKIRSTTDENEKRIWTEFRGVEEDKTRVIFDKISLTRLENQELAETENLRRIEEKMKGTEDSFTKKIFEDAIQKVKDVLFNIANEIKKVRDNSKLGFLDLQGQKTEDSETKDVKLMIAKIEASVQLQKERIAQSEQELMENMSLIKERIANNPPHEELLSLEQFKEMQESAKRIAYKKESSVVMKEEILSIIKVQLSDQLKMKDLKQRLILVTSQHERFDILNKIKSLRHHVFESAKIEAGLIKLKIELDSFIVDLQKTLYIERLAQLEAQLRITVSAQDKMDLTKQVKFEKIKLQELVKRTHNLSGMQKKVDSLLLRLKNPKFTTGFHNLDSHGNLRVEVKFQKASNSTTASDSDEQKQRNQAADKRSNLETLLNYPISREFHKIQNGVRKFLFTDEWVDD